VRPELQRLYDELTEVRIALASVEDTSRRVSNGWTVAQVLDHLAKVHNKTVPVFREALAHTSSRNGDDPVRYSFLDRQLVKMIGGKTSVKLPVPPMFEPAEAGPEAKLACLSSIDDLLAIIEDADKRVLAGVVVSSPVNARLRLGLLPYLDATVGHARYHQKQI